MLHTGSIAAFLQPGANRTLDAMRSRNGAETTFDPNIRPDLIGDRTAAVLRFESAARLATVIKLSDEDADWLYPRQTSDAVIDSLLAAGPNLVAITLGAAGAILATRHERIEVPGVPVEVVDTIGAGDTFMASLIASILETPSDSITAKILAAIGNQAVAAAAITVSRRGADLPSHSDLLSPLAT